MHTKILTLLLAFIFCDSAYTQSGKVILQIENIRTKKGGAIAAGVFTEKNFLKTGQELAGITKDVSASTMVFVFENLNPGEYALLAYQDIDRNKKMKTNFIGYPKEPWGVSNNPPILFGPPAFKESKVLVKANQTTTLTIRLN